MKKYGATQDLLVIIKIKTNESGGFCKFWRYSVVFSREN